MTQNLHIVIIEDEAATARNLEYILQEIDPGLRLLQHYKALIKQ